MGLTGERLRLEALRVLRESGDARATDAVERGAVTLDPDVVTWESSRGRVSGHRVLLDVPEDLLASLEASPPAMDSLHAAFAAALVVVGERDALVDLRIGRLRMERLESPYRGPSPRRG
jgi:hypothetical protein